MKHRLKLKGHSKNLLSVLLVAGIPLAAAAQGVPIAILNGSFEHATTTKTATADGGIPGKGIGYVTDSLPEWYDIDRNTGVPGGVSGNLNGASGQPTGNNGRPRDWTYTGTIVQDNIATDARWHGVWNSYQVGPTDGLSAIILDNRSGQVSGDQVAEIFMKQTLSMNVGELKALGSQLVMSFDARYGEGSQAAVGFDADGDDFIKVYFEVSGVQDVAGTWETRFDATRVVRNFSEINGQLAQPFYGFPPARSTNYFDTSHNTIGAQNMDTFTATLDLSAYGDDNATVTMVVHNARYKDDGVNSASNRVYMDNIRVEAVTAGPARRFEIVEVTRAGDSVAFRFNSVPGRTYAVDFSNDLVAWEELDDSVMGEAESATTGFTEQPVPEGPDPRFYRVREP